MSEYRREKGIVFASMKRIKQAAGNTEAGVKAAGLFLFIWIREGKKKCISIVLRVIGKHRTMGKEYEVS